MSARWWTFLIWALVAASALFWGLRLFVSGKPLPPRTAVASAAPVVQGDLTRLLGVDPPPPAPEVEAEPPPDARFQLIGVVAPQSRAAAREGVALIAVDGKPAKAYRVGAVVDGQTIVKSVAARGATLGPRDGAAQVNLTLAPPPAAATGTLPGVDVGGAPVAPAAPTGLPMQAPRPYVPPQQAPNLVNGLPQPFSGPPTPPQLRQQTPQNRLVLPPPQSPGNALPQQPNMTGASSS